MDAEGSRMTQLNIRLRDKLEIDYLRRKKNEIKLVSEKIIHMKHLSKTY